MQDVSRELLIRSLDKAVAETLETMFFSDAVPAADPQSPDASVRSVVRFSGDATGKVELGLATEQAHAFTCNFLGIDGMAVAANQIESVCGEMANMICGTVLSATLPEGRFDLDQPAIVPVSQAHEPCPLGRSYMTDTGSIAVSLLFSSMEPTH